ncbi:MAG: isopentenyl-diphosphate Delta-isomerase [Chitinophagaceae bacterium]|nr:isopentenyl-diphosphate Delta-isomerase [Chitinophagaceae bacterium]
MDVILVDEQDNPIGTMGKMEVHEKALLHRAFSIFIFNDKGELLLQKRAPAKYHSGGLWTNTCCSHPKPGEDTATAAHKRLQEEMGFSTPLNKAFTFLYKAPFENGLTEHEYDHVFTGIFNGLIKPDPDEVSDYCYLSLEKLKANIQSRPDHFTEWFKIALPELEAYMKACD